MLCVKMSLITNMFSIFFLKIYKTTSTQMEHLAFAFILNIPVNLSHCLRNEEIKMDTNMYMFIAK